MDTTDRNQNTGTDPGEGYVDQDNLEAAKEHEGREETNIAAELLDSVSGGDDIDGDNGRSAEDDLADPDAVRGGLSAQKPETD